MGGRRLRHALLAAVGSGALLLGGLGVVPAAAAPEPDPLTGYVTQGRPGVAASEPALLEADEHPVRRTVDLDDFLSDTPPSPAQGVSRVSVTQDLRAGVVEARATYRATPTAGTDSLLFLYVGEWTSGTCERRLAIATQAVGGERVGAFLSGRGGTYTHDGAVALTVTRSGATVTVRTVAVDRIRTADWDCAYFAVTEPRPTTATPVVHQQAYAETFKQHWAPGLTMDLGLPVQGNHRGRWTKVRIQVRNTSRSPANGVKVTPQGAGLEFAPRSRDLGTIDERSSAYGVEFKVRLKGKKPKKKQRRAVFVATTGAATFKQAVTIAERPRPKKLKTLTGRYWWGSLPVTQSSGWDTRALWFVDERWVHVGFAKDGRKPRCSARVKGCKRYTYNPRTGRVKIGGQRAKVTSEGFALKVAKGDPKVRWYPTTLARKGQRFRAELVRNDYSGNCLLSCTTWTEWLSLDSRGRFVLSRTSLSSFGVPGSQSWFSAVPPDRRGTYEVGKNGRVVLRFADGKRRAYTLAVEHDVRNKPSASGAGLVLGDRNFYP